MAHPVNFKPEPVDPHTELMKRVEAAPREHAEALLVAWDVLQAAHDQGMLDLLHGLLGGRNLIAEKLAEAVNTTDGVNFLRNVLAAGRILSAIDPDFLYKFSKALDRELQPGGASAPGTAAPTLLQLFRKVRAEDTRRGLGLALGLVSALGSATQE